MTHSKPLRVGVIGVGHLGAIHTKLWNGVDGAQLMGVYDASAERAREVAEACGTHAYADLDEMLGEVEAVTIAASTSYHFEIAKECLAAGVHCFIEKPITSTYEQALELIRIAEENDLLVQVGHVERFNPALSALRSYGAAPRFIEAHRLAQFKPRATDVSVVHDLMIHDIDIVLALVGSPVESVAANGVAVLTETTDIANARITFANGCVANLTASRIAQKQMRKMRIFQADAYMAVDFASSEVEVFRVVDEAEVPQHGSPAVTLGHIDRGTTKKSIVMEKPAVEPANAILLEQHHFVQAIRHGQPVPVSARDGAEALRIADEIAAKTVARFDAV